MDPLLERLTKIDQCHLYPHLLALAEEKREKILQQMEIATQKIANSTKREAITSFVPLTSADRPTDEDILVGENVLSTGQVAVCMLAGGMGTRLGFEGPKGCFPITPIKKKSLFQLACEKIKAAQEKYKTTFFLVIMTSPRNHEETLNFFEEQHYFGLQKEQILFFSQSMLPFTDDEGKFFFEDSSHLSMGPSGNGSLYRDIQESGVLSFLEEKKIRYLQVVYVDNPLADPLDASLIGSHVGKQNEVTIAVIDQKEPQELMGGLIVDQNQKLRIVEYGELPETVSLSLFNIGLYCWDLSFIKKVNFSLFLHKTKKETRIWEEGKAHPIKAWKYESFIFEGFDAAKKTKIGAVLKEKKECFSPLKNARGNNSISQVQKDLVNREKEILQSFGVFPPAHEKFEIDPRFYYPTKEFLVSCKKQEIV